MKFQIESELNYTLHGPATFLFAVAAQKTGGQRVTGESLVFPPDFPADKFTVGNFGNTITRIRAAGEGPFRVSYRAEVERDFVLVPVAELEEHAPHELAPEAVPYLFPSRYCQSDMLRQAAGEIFGHLTGTHAIAAAISDWVHENTTYSPGASVEQSSATETFSGRAGVCRDFAHLAIAFCRAMNIPARYVSCYAWQLSPPDFHAVFEAFIGGSWFVFDPTRLAPLNGLVRIATGRDAADTAVSTIFGNPALGPMSISCQSAASASGNPEPVTRDTLLAANLAISLR